MRPTNAFIVLTEPVTVSHRDELGEGTLAGALEVVKYFIAYVQFRLKESE